MDSSPLTPAIILVQSQEEGNIGAVARTMANMGLDELVLVDPQAPIGPTARAFAVGAGYILDSVRITDTLTDGLAPYHCIIGTTSTRGREVTEPLLKPRQLPSRLLQEAAETTTAIVFGPESSGLQNDQLSLCGLLVRVPCSLRQPTLNLAQAVLIVAYELYLTRLETAAVVGGERPLPATAGDLDGLFTQILPLLESIGFARDDTFEGVLRDLRQLSSRAGPTNREVTILRGICRRALRALGHH
jgi:TrmH family RNA methyltransferase